MIDTASPKLENQEFVRLKQEAKSKMETLYPDQPPSEVFYKIPLESNQAGQKPISKIYPSYPGDLWVIFYWDPKHLVGQGIFSDL